MRGGFSGCKGIMLYDKDIKEQNNAVYGYYDNDEIVIIEGSYDEIFKLKKDMDEEYKKDKDPVMKYMFILLVCYVFIVGISFFLFDLLTFTAVLFFCICSYYPVLILIITLMNQFQNKEYNNQFKRYHGAEHAGLSLLSKEKELTLENIKKENIYHTECGSAYTFMSIILCLIISYLIMHVFTIGLLKAIAIILISIIIMFICLFIPYNPFILPQLFLVNKPSEHEYLLAIALIERLKSLSVDNQGK